MFSRVCRNLDEIKFIETCSCTHYACICHELLLVKKKKKKAG